jgi:hypothetical protein
LSAAETHERRGAADGHELGVRDAARMGGHDEQQRQRREASHAAR